MSNSKKTKNMTNVTQEHFFNLSIDMLCIAGLDGYFKHLNLSWEQTLGWTNEELLDKPFIEFVHPEDREKTIKVIQNLTAGENAIVFENRFKCKNGEYKWFSWNAIPITGQNLIYAIARDITERKRIDQELKNNQQKYQSLFNKANDYIILIDEKGNIIELNEKASEFVGGERSNVIGQNLMKVSFLSKEDKRKAFESFKERLSSRGVGSYELEFIRYDGEKLNGEVNANIIDLDDGTKCDLVVVRDITNRKRTEEELKLLTERLSLATRSAEIGIWDWDVKNNILVWDDSMYNLYGVKKEDFSGAYEAWVQGLHSDDKESGEKEIEMALKGEKYFDTEFRVVWPDDSIHSIRAIATVMRDNDGKPLRMVGVNWDITERNKAEVLLKTRNDMLDIISRSQSKFIAEIEPRYIFDELLENLLALTKSEYGYIGEVLLSDNGDPFLKSHAITNIAWNKETRDFYKKNAPKGMEFHNLKTLFGTVMTSGKPVISNSPSKDNRSGGLPKGHPPLNSFLGIPFYSGKKMIGMVGIANRPDGYSEDIIEYLKPFLSTCANLIEGYSTRRHRKEAEKALEESEGRLELALKGADLGLWDWNIKTGEVVFNQRWAEMLGYSLDEIIPNVDSWYKLNHPEDVPLIEKALKDHFEGKTEIYETEHRMKTKSGEWKWILDRGRVFERDKKGNPLRATGTHLDITERKISEDELIKKTDMLENYSSNLKILNNIATTQYDSFNALITDYLDAGKKIFNLSTGILSEIKGNEYLVRATKTDLDFLKPELVFELKDTYCKLVVTKVKTIAFNSAKEVHKNKIHPIFPNEYFESYISAPVFVNGKIYGTLNFSSPVKREQAFQDYEFDIIELMAESIGKFIAYEEVNTERKKTEEEKRKLSVAVEQSPSTVVITDINGNIIYVNPKFTDLTGYKEKEVIGKNPRILKSTERPSAEYKPLWETVTAGKIWRGEFINKKKNGEHYWESASISPIKDIEGNITSFIKVAEDITERKRIEKELTESEERTRTVINTLVDAVITINDNGIVESFNLAAEALFGYDKEEVIGKNVNILMPEPYHGNHDGFLSNYLKTGEAKIIGIGRQVKAKRKDGIIFPIELAVGEMRFGSKSAFVGIVKDITERKRGEEERNRLIDKLQEKSSQLNITLNSVGDGIVVTDDKLNVLSSNPAFADLMGLPMYRIRGQLCTDIMKMDEHSKDNIADLRGLMLEAVNSGQKTSRRFAIENHEGKKITLEAINSPMKNIEGKIIGSVFSFRDVSREAEIDKMKNEFISTVSHELRTPLTSIKGYIDLILSGDTGEINELQQEFLDIVYQNSDRLNNLINDLLDVEKIESGKIDLKFEKISLSDLVSHAVKTMHNLADEKGLNFDSKIKDGIEIIGDRDKLVQVLTNLISNSIKFTKQGEISVELKAIQEKSLIIVRDTGIGISKVDQKNLFKKFFRADNEYVREVGGTGLGLSIVQAIVEKHGGMVKIKSELGQGSEFRIIIPMKK
ncbi:PAS domain S-box protein [candidate division KSB1 bacterium]